MVRRGSHVPDIHQHPKKAEQNQASANSSFLGRAFGSFILSPFQKSACSTLAERPIDKVERAFLKFDTNGDGFLSKEEFGTVRVIRELTDVMSATSS